MPGIVRSAVVSGLLAAKSTSPRGATRTLLEREVASSRVMEWVTVFTHPG